VSFHTLRFREKFLLVAAGLAVIAAPVVLNGRLVQTQAPGAATAVPAAPYVERLLMEQNNADAGSRFVSRSS
jgi:hypothetical protein